MAYVDTDPQEHGLFPGKLLEYRHVIPKPGTHVIPDRPSDYAYTKQFEIERIGRTLPKGIGGKD